MRRLLSCGDSYCLPTRLCMLLEESKSCSSCAPHNLRTTLFRNTVNFVNPNLIDSKFELLNHDLSIHFLRDHLQMSPSIGVGSLKNIKIFFSFVVHIAHLRQGCHNSKFWHFWVTGVERNVCKYTFNRFSVIVQFAKLAAGEQLCRRSTHRRLQHFKTSLLKNPSFWVVTLLSQVSDMSGTNLLGLFQFHMFPILYVYYLVCVRISFCYIRPGLPIAFYIDLVE